jgi:DnaJ-class molecular chaperone
LLSFEEIDKARQLLGLPQEATLSEIKDAYRRRAKEYHPDKQKLGKRKEYSQKMTRINKAYEILMDYLEQYRFSFSEEEVKKNDPDRDMRRFSKDWLGGR